MSLFTKISDLFDEYSNKAIKAYDETFPADGVNPINETLNENDKEYNSQAGIAYRTHYLTRISSFIGLPNRKLYKEEGQSRKNLWDNFLGKQENPSKSKFRRGMRTAIVVPLNIIFLPFRLIRNILKFVMELIPLTCSEVLWKISDQLFAQSSSFFTESSLPTVITIIISLAIATPAVVALFFGAIFKGIHLTNRCLLSAYDSLCSAWKYGRGSNHRNPLAYFFCGLSIFTTIIMFCFALPIAAKLFAISVGPIIIHHLPAVIDIALNKMAHSITPILSAIGRPVTVITDFIISLTNIPLSIALPILTHIPALVGGSLFIATAIATVGLVANKFINDFKAWWNYNPNYPKPYTEEVACSKTSCMTSILSALGWTDTATAAPARSATSDYIPPSGSATNLPTASLLKRTASGTLIASPPDAGAGETLSEGEPEEQGHVLRQQ